MHIILALALIVMVGGCAPYEENRSLSGSGFSIIDRTPTRLPARPKWERDWSKWISAQEARLPWAEIDTSDEFWKFRIERFIKDLSLIRISPCYRESLALVLDSDGLVKMTSAKPSGPVPVGYNPSSIFLEVDMLTDAYDMNTLIRRIRQELKEYPTLPKEINLRDVYMESGGVC